MILINKKMFHSDRLLVLGPTLHTAMFLKNAKSVIMSYKIFIDNLHVDATFHIVSDQPPNKGLDV